MPRRWTPALLLAAVFVGAPALALGDDSSQPADTAAPGPTLLARNPATVRYAPGRLLVGFEEAASEAKVNKLARRAGAKLKRSIGKIDARVLEVPNARIGEAMASLKASPAVEYVEREVLLEGSATVPNDALWEKQWGPKLVGAPEAWDATRGSAGIVIAVLDTGVDYGHPDLRGMFVQGHDFINNDADPRDDHGHGTAAAGVIAARTHNGEGQAGICWTCSIMPVKVLDANGSGTSSALASGIVWAADHGARVISLSLGGAGTTQTLANAVAYAANKGVLLIAAAGNAGTTTKFYPAAYPQVVSVGGTTSSDKLYEWSNRGDWVQVAAPGCNTAPYVGGGYVNFCGTSSATPLVAGIAGLALSLAPDLAKSTFEQALRNSAVPVPGGVRYGRVDLPGTLGALAAAGVTPPINTKRPRIRGTPRVGRSLHAENGQWSGSPTTFAYQWRRCNRKGKKCSNIAGAVAQTYVVSNADVGSKLVVLVRAANASGVKDAVSKPTGIVKRRAKSAKAASQKASAGEDFRTTASGAPPPSEGSDGSEAPPPSSLTEAIESQVDSTAADVSETAGEVVADPAAPLP